MFFARDVKPITEQEGSFVIKEGDAEKQICLECPLPECKGDYCRRYKQELSKIRRKKNGIGEST